jgi:hypothetical protein
MSSAFSSFLVVAGGGLANEALINLDDLSPTLFKKKIKS